MVRFHQSDLLSAAVAGVVYEVEDRGGNLTRSQTMMTPGEASASGQFLLTMVASLVCFRRLPCQSGWRRCL